MLKASFTLAFIYNVVYVLGARNILNDNAFQFVSIDTKLLNHQYLRYINQLNSFTYTNVTFSKSMFNDDTYHFHICSLIRSMLRLSHTAFQSIHNVYMINHLFFFSKIIFHQTSTRYENWTRSILCTLKLNLIVIANDRAEHFIGISD